jgi:dynein heavy chain
MLSRGLKPTPIEFFKLVTNDEKLQEFFCYCNRKEEFYDFEVVNFQEKNDNEYITVSKRGIIHFIKGIPNFISVYQFEREANIYKKIKGIKFFNLFKCWKNFSNWKTLMRRTMFNKTKAFLKKDLFY